MNKYCLLITLGLVATMANGQYYNYNNTETIVTRERPTWQGGGIETKSSEGWSAVTTERPTWQGGGVETKFDNGTKVITTERPTWQGGGTETKIIHGNGW